MKDKNIQDSIKPEITNNDDSSQGRHNTRENEAVVKKSIDEQQQLEDGIY